MCKQVTLIQVSLICERGGLERKRIVFIFNTRILQGRPKKNILYFTSLKEILSRLTNFIPLTLPRHYSIKNNSNLFQRLLYEQIYIKKKKKSPLPSCQKILPKLSLTNIKSSINKPRLSQYEQELNINKRYTSSIRRGGGINWKQQMLYIYTYTHNLTRKFKIILPGKIQEGKGGEGILVFRKFRISISLTIVMRLVDMYISSLDGNRRCIVSLSLSLSLPLCSRNRDPEIRQGRKRDSGGRTPRRELLYDFCVEGGGTRSSY